jgi:alanine racemase
LTYDEVTIIGGKNEHYAEIYNMAKDSETITYEITTRINPIIKRFYGINPKIKRVFR